MQIPSLPVAHSPVHPDAPDSEDRKMFHIALPGGTTFPISRKDLLLPLPRFKQLLLAHDIPGKSANYRAIHAVRRAEKVKGNSRFHRKIAAQRISTDAAINIVRMCLRKHFGEHPTVSAAIADCEASLRAAVSTHDEGGH
eukprot:m.88049 g.88049  ORF g.88049 m.88049 type:complete len:140 (+) comp8348_c0_seq2:646-1065(+)